jgi:hypothetical protein
VAAEKKIALLFADDACMGRAKREGDDGASGGGRADGASGGGRAEVFEEGEADAEEEKSSGTPIAIECRTCITGIRMCRQQGTPGHHPLGRKEAEVAGKKERTGRAEVSGNTEQPPSSSSSSSSSSSTFVASTDDKRSRATMERGGGREERVHGYKWYMDNDKRSMLDMVFELDTNKVR